MRRRSSFVYKERVVPSAFISLVSLLVSSLLRRFSLLAFSFEVETFLAFWGRHLLWPHAFLSGVFPLAWAADMVLLSVGYSLLAVSPRRLFFLLPPDTRTKAKEGTITKPIIRCVPWFARLRFPALLHGLYGNDGQQIPLARPPRYDQRHTNLSRFSLSCRWYR